MSHILPIPTTFAIVDIVIIALYVIQMMWGARLGFAAASFALTGEIIGFILGILYASSLANFLNTYFHFESDISNLLISKTNIPAQYVNNFSQTLFSMIVFLLIFTVVQSIFFRVGKRIHHRIGAKRATFVPNAFFGALVGALKATLDVLFLVIVFSSLGGDPNVQGALKSTGFLNSVTNGSILLPVFTHLVPPSSPISKFFLR